MLLGSSGRARPTALLTETTNLSIDGSWTVVVRDAPIVTGLSSVTQAALVFAGGAIVSVLLFLLLLVLSRSRAQALALVAEKTGQLRHRALHDSLTGLPNRTLALDRAERILSRARRAQVPVAALYVDIDGLQARQRHVRTPGGRPAAEDCRRAAEERDSQERHGRPAVGR
jgi:hypothetical protein